MKIQIENLSKSYKRVKALNNVNFSIESPCLIGLVGPNGAGKSTLMKLLVGQLMPTEGSICIDGMELSKNENYLKERLGYVPQDFGLYDNLTVYEFLDYIAAVKGIKSNVKGKINQCIKKTNLNDKKDKKIKTLSGGQKQRVGIAQAFLNDPELLIVDEPTVGLDPEERIKFRNLFSENASDKLVILSTHIIEDVEAICNLLIVMDKGKILYFGSPSELIKRAEGHVSTIHIKNEKENEIRGDFKITSRIITSDGVKYKIVGDKLPSSAVSTTPTLEDAYVYCMLKEGESFE
ncbi:ABC-type multidrug transport system ATPase subunit [Clostridium tetanomorphum]|uniref:ABC transporter ATP-binding protein n=1 Tax=Clostridium tetanomorphum TaxID=1553 RepID=A0A923EDZ5_CLOTT|nr:ABC transporter ATP-binding protein [Clostridium tetanomorphum]KAJ50587.1 ABC transporter ATP-binding protein [Clostridium tetanomorphum DSM 665]MBC2399048.1 ABC transporter ATP-binding protein [Clostridium tetanomorphum]MBP1862661.1 ABC-type multidrug transport system ATPase subunit [Clostridium tetanomorphum]NRS85498.1 ABC-type multidrug transport system ATPase subunit [Clostridium tetanomorphum]NRZ98612.1 ABC-type multidrug transport system ATPase subunit [Clostridium tetanomorphum]